MYIYKLNMLSFITCTYDSESSTQIEPCMYNTYATLCILYIKLARTLWSPSHADPCFGHRACM